MDEVSVDKNDLNRAMLNFFVVEGMKGAAEKFCKETRHEVSPMFVLFAAGPVPICVDMIWSPTAVPDTQICAGQD